jgi:Eukaryotic cytochrome b561
MTATQNAQTTLPHISGTSNVATRAQGSAYRALVVLHALLLGVAFIVVFPLGVIGLRWKWSVSFGVHWITQSIASIAAFVGLAVAIALSIVGIEYDGFDEGHQILGIVVVALLVLQITAGYIHHARFKVLGRRTSVSYAHLWLGRIVIYGGMLNAIL